MSDKWLEDAMGWTNTLFSSAPESTDESFFNLGGDVPSSMSLGDEYSLGNVLGNAASSTDSGNWYDAFLSPAVLGAAITSGAGLLGNLNALDIQKEQLKTAQEQQKMNQLLELAKLKYQLLGKGASTSSGRRSSGRGGGSGAANSALNTQLSANLASGYQNLGNSLSSIYRS